MHDPSPTNPGLTYDPRHGTTGGFFASLQKELDKQSKLIGKSANGPVQKPKDYQKPTPLPDPGRPITGDFKNPRYKLAAGYTVRV